MPSGGKNPRKKGCGGVTGGAERCKALLGAQYERVKALISTEADALKALADALMEAESLEGVTAEAILDAHLSNNRPKSA